MKSMRDSFNFNVFNINPYRSYEVGQSISIFPKSTLYEYVSHYFPDSNFSAKIADIISPNEYSIKIDRYKDIIEASHWSVRPKNLYETRSFAPIGLIAPGVNVKLIDSGEIKRVMKVDGTYVVSDDMSRTKNERLVVILAERWERPLIESFIRK